MPQQETTNANRVVPKAKKITPPKAIKFHLGKVPRAGKVVEPEQTDRPPRARKFGGGAQLPPRVIRVEPGVEIPGVKRPQYSPRKQNPIQGATRTVDDVNRFSRSIRNFIKTVSK